MKNLLLAGLLLSSLGAWGQQRPPVVQCTGLVVSGDSLVGVPGVRVAVPSTSRHTVTDATGYFSLAVLAGDSLVFRSAGYTTHIVVPAAYPHQSYSLLVQFKQDAATLRPVPASFTRNFLTLKLPAERAFVAPDDRSRTFMKLIFKQPAAKK